MSRATNKRKTTTVSCDESTRQFIASEAERTGKLQREVLAQMVKVYQQDQQRSAKKKKEEAQELRNANEILAAIDTKLEKLTKRDDVVIGYIKEHEKLYGSPTLDKMKNCETRLGQLISILQNLK